MAIENTAAIRFEALADGFRRGVDEATKALSGFENGANRAADAAAKVSKSASQGTGKFQQLITQSRTLGGLMTGVGAAIAGINPGVAVAVAGAGLLAASFGKTVNRAIQLADSFNAVSKRTGFAIETLSQLKFVAEQNESSFEVLQVGLRFFNRNIGQAASGGKEAQAAFKRLGVEITDSAGKLRSSEDILNRVSDGLKNTRSVALRTSLALAIFGRGSQSLVPLLSQGSEAIAKQRQEADALGATISTRFARQADDFGDNLGRLRTLSQGLGIQLAQAVVPALNRFLVLVIPLAQKAIPLLVSTIGGLAFGFSKVVATIDLVSASIFKLIAVVTRNKEGIAAADEATIKASNTLTQSRRAFDAMTEAMLKNIPVTEEFSEGVKIAGDETARLNELLNQFAERDISDIGIQETAARKARFGAKVPGPREAQLDLEQLEVPELDFETPFQKGMRAAEEFFATTVDLGQASFQALGSFADGFANALTSGADLAKIKFGDFFKQLLRDLLRAIVRAIILKTILGIFGGGLGSIGKAIQAALGAGGGGTGGFPQREEAALAGRAQIARGAGSLEPTTTAATQNLAPQINVQVFEPGPLTKIILTDTVVIPRLRQRLRQLGEESFTR